MKKVKFIVKSGSDQIMVHWPSGSVEFFGFWASIKLAWWILRNGRDIEVINGD